MKVLIRSEQQTGKANRWSWADSDRYRIYLEWPGLEVGSGLLYAEASKGRMEPVLVSKTCQDLSRPVCWSLLSLTLTAGISHFPFFLNQGRRDSPLSSIRNLREGLGVAPAYENGVGVRPEGEILLP